MRRFLCERLLTIQWGMNRNRVRIVLVETTHAGNIGAAARAMKTMGLADLALVRPREYQTHECYARASGADDIIDNATVHTDLRSALEEASWVIGTSARLRSLRWPQYDAREAALQVGQHTGEGQVAVVFGRESSGLSNDELARCSALLSIPAASEFGSLNLGAAVQVVSYEILMASKVEQQRGIALQSGAHQPDKHQSDKHQSDKHQSDKQIDTSRPAALEAPAVQRDLEHFYSHLADVMSQVDFLDKDNPRLLDGRLRRLFNRSGLLKTEVQLLRGFFSAIEKKMAGNKT